MEKYLKISLITLTTVLIVAVAFFIIKFYGEDQSFSLIEMPVKEKKIKPAPLTESDREFLMVKEVTKSPEENKVIKSNNAKKTEVEGMIFSINDTNWTIELHEKNNTEKKYILMLTEETMVTKMENKANFMDLSVGDNITVNGFLKANSDNDFFAEEIIVESSFEIPFIAI